MYWFIQNRKEQSIYRNNDCWSPATSPGATVTVPPQHRRICNMDNRPHTTEHCDPRIRWELVQRVRREIAAGTYETPEKLEEALEQFLQCLEQE
jgi:hypothetical protein